MKPNTETTAAALAVIGVDIGKEVFHLVGFGADGKIAFRKKIRRLDLKGAFEAGYISATSDRTSSLANSSRSIH